MAETDFVQDTDALWVSDEEARWEGILGVILNAILDDLKRRVDLDAVLKELGRTKTLDLDAVLKFVKTKDVDLDAILRAAITKAVDLDAVIKELGRTKTLDLDSDIYDMLGWAWGQSDTSHVEIPEVWSVWKTSGGATATYDTVFGLLQLKSGETFYSDVKDMGSATLRLLTIDIDKYGSGSGTQGTIQWRGSENSFNWNDGSPSWENYPSGGAGKTWRYIQVRVTG